MKPMIAISALAVTLIAIVDVDAQHAQGSEDYMRGYRDGYADGRRNRSGNGIGGGIQVTAPWVPMNPAMMLDVFSHGPMGGGQFETIVDAISLLHDERHLSGVVLISPPEHHGIDRIFTVPVFRHSDAAHIGTRSQSGTLGNWLAQLESEGRTIGLLDFGDANRQYFHDAVRAEAVFGPEDIDGVSRLFGDALPVVISPNVFVLVD